MFVLNVVDGCIPSDLATGKTEEIEEERRLLYVAMTRAKDQLALIVPHRFYTHGQSRTGDQHLYASRSRFIPASVAGAFERTTWPAARPDAAVNAPRRSETRIDVGARARSMWR